ncbi:MAG: DUF5107 domain-containing protein [Flavobacteriaceae bacterium]
MRTRATIYVFLLIIFNGIGVWAQSAKISEEKLSLNTYSFEDPNPVPILKDNPKIYPYYKFESYRHESEKKEWTVVTLENDFIKVFVLPEIGGKVWGAIEKSTGEEFLYKNEVVKFRNIAMRGPWTSGGIEFNFGIIGHHPSTATPVDYTTRENADGSVSCIVGNLDLPSRTLWQVEIKIEKDKAFFETNASWYNPTPVNQAYYNWMTAAAVATEDLEFFIPGDEYLKHNGDALPWPVDSKNRNLAFYKNNNFGPSKSYHIVGDYKDFFGGYYHNRNFGFGHWSPYEEMPGQKLWLWALSRSGGIWEDLLTDTDGQYIEFQAGRLFNQYFPGAVNPISQANFGPYVMDRWRELWFPIKAIGGMEAANEYGVLNVEYDGNKAIVGFNALQNIAQDLMIRVNGTEVFSEALNLKPMEVYSKEIRASSADTLEVNLGNGNLYYSNIPEKTLIKRPFHQNPALEVSETQQLFNEGWEAMKYREYDKAYEALAKLAKLDPSNQQAWTKLAELEYRRTNYQKAVAYSNNALKMDTYDVEANYLAGISYAAMKDHINALESLGWAARDMKYRSAAYAQMAEIYTQMKDYKAAESYAKKALIYNGYNGNAHQLLLILSRINDDQSGFRALKSKIQTLDPLNHIVLAESYLNSGNTGFAGINNEFSSETALEAALFYYKLGREEDMLRLLERFPGATKLKLWRAFLLKNKEVEASQALLSEIEDTPINFVLPYRRETLKALQWAQEERPNWKTKYYAALNKLAVGLRSEGEKALLALGVEPDSEVFYRFRAKYLDKESYDTRQKDYQKALDLNNKDWKLWEEYIQFNLSSARADAAYQLSKKAYKKFGDNYNIGLSHAKAALQVDNYAECIDVLRKINILPFEHASESKQIYDHAHIFLAHEKMSKGNYNEAVKLLEASKEWPENLGVGQPYDVDSRLQDYLLGIAYEKTGQGNLANQMLKQVADYSLKHKDTYSPNDLFGLLALKKLAKGSELQILKESLTLNSDKDLMSKAVLVLFDRQKEDDQELQTKLDLPEELWRIMQESSH